MNPISPFHELKQETAGILAPVSGISGAECFKQSLLSSDELDTLEIPPRESLVGGFWREGSLGFLFGPRGLGKTWLAVHMARCLAEGRDCGPWSVAKARRVLYVDGEMALDGLRERNRALSRKGNAPLFYLSHQQHFVKANCGLNLSHHEMQRALTQECIVNGIEVMFLDNLSCLFSGMRENDADDWETVLPWLLDLRRKGIAVCIVHHSGRNGTNMRGTSRREDAAFWVMKLEAPNAADTVNGARFIGRFTKNREGDEVDAGPWQWTFTAAGNGTTEAHHTRMDNLDMFVQHVRDGIESCTDIAAEMGVTAGTVSKWAKRAVTAGLIRICGKRYLLP